MIFTLCESPCRISNGRKIRMNSYVTKTVYR